MSNQQIPESFGVSPQAAAAAKAAMSPDLTAPEETAKFAVDKNGVRHARWVESGTVEAVWRQNASKGAVSVLKVAVRFRPGQPNQNKTAWFNLTINRTIAAGISVSDDERKSYEGLTHRNIAAMTTLLDVTGYLPESGNITNSLINTLFPMKGQKSPLEGKKVAVAMHQKPAKEEFNGRTTDLEAERFLPELPLVEDGKETD